MLSMERQIRELNAFDPRGANVFSLYLHTDPLQHERADLVRQLDGAARALREDLPPQSRAALDREIEEVTDYLGSMIAPPAAIAVFTCTPHHFFRVIRLPVEVSTAAYWAPWTHVATLLEVETRAAELAHRPLAYSPTPSP
jgi:hypothetical protein